MTEAPRVELTPLREEDLDDVLAIEIASQPAPWSRALFASDLSARERALWLAVRSAGRVVGYGGSWRIADEMTVVNLAVDPALRRRGLGRTLLRGLLDAARGEGKRIATLEVRASRSEAIALYESEGFRAIALRRGFYPPDGEDALVMLRELAS